MALFGTKESIFRIFWEKFWFFTHFICILLCSFCATLRFPASIELWSLTRFIELLTKNSQKEDFRNFWFSKKIIKMLEIFLLFLSNHPYIYLCPFRRIQKLSHTSHFSKKWLCPRKKLHGEKFSNSINSLSKYVLDNSKSIPIKKWLLNQWGNRELSFLHI